RYRDSFVVRSPAIGFRCVKLGTTSAPLRLRFVNEKTLVPVGEGELQVWASHFGLGDRDAIQAKGSTDFEGKFAPKDKEPYKNVAFVRVLKNNDVLAQFPVEILDDRIIICKVPSDRNAGPAGELIARQKRLLDQINESLAVHANLNKDLGDIIRTDQQQAASRAQKA